MVSVESIAFSVTVQCIVCSIECAVYSVQCAVRRLPRASDGRTEYTEAVQSVECTEAVLLTLPAETELCCWKYVCALSQGD